MPVKKLIAFLLLSGCCMGMQAQAPSFSFHQLSTGNGLSEPTIRAVAQDTYGYIWIGTANGLNRYNGYDVKVFQHQANDPHSLHENRVFALLMRRTGDLWIAQPQGLSRYEYATGRFTFFPSTINIAAYKLLEGTGPDLYLATRQGLVVFNTQTGAVNWLKTSMEGASARLLARYINDICRVGPDIFLATDSGLVRYSMRSRVADIITAAPIKDVFIGHITTDTANNLWISYGDNGLRLLKTTARFDQFRFCDQFILGNTQKTDNRLTATFCDSKARLWISTSQFGLCLYNDSSNSFDCYRHDPLQTMSISDNLTNSLFQDRQGYIWVGTEVSGVNYFHPDKTFFRSIQPSYTQSPTLPDYWCRAAGEDKNGQLWLATGQGVAAYDIQHDRYTLFQHTTDKNNSLAFNSVRSVLCDDDMVWIGTANGLNRYQLNTHSMDFFGEKDSLPESFFWTIAKDHTGNIWFGCRDGIYRYNKLQKRITSFIGHPQLGAYAHTNTVVIYEDSRQRLWFGFNSKGLMMYDPGHAITRYWQKNESDPNAISDDHVTSITEDKKGVIWIATLDGLNAYHEQGNTFTKFLYGKGMTSCLLTDEANRLWIASSKGLLMLNSERNFFTSFDLSNGLPTIDFNYQSAYRLKNGDFIYPTLRGFVLFNPARYVRGNTILETYVSAFTLYGNKTDTLPNFEDKQSISLRAAQNFFSIDMIALNYGNPKEVWYAHKMEPFDKEWVYSKDRTVNYTNVPGGNYIFRYKSSTDVNNWNTHEKTVSVAVGTIYYKTWWFRAIMGCLLAGLLLMLYKYRIAQREKVFSLQAKANALEKEKVLVMYESLKQQLNPHFLFNSLTSLSGLISANPTHARQFLDRMSKIYRYILTSRDHETVSLAEEIKLAGIYTDLQQTRFREGLQVEVNVPENDLHRKIAPVTVQNLIENAIKHNIVDEARPLRVSIFVEDNQLIVRNNLQKKKFVETSNKQGLANMQSLYNYLGGRPISVLETETDFIVKVPLL